MATPKRNEMLRNTFIWTTAAAILLAATAAQAVPVDLSTWTAEGGGNWVLSASGKSVTQTINSPPTVFFGAGDAQGSQLSGKIKVSTTRDDDFIGFVLGFQSGDLTRATTDFLVIDWKQSDQTIFGCTGTAGLSISRVTAGFRHSGGAWCHNGLGVSELARGANLGSTGWSDYTSYSYDLIFTATNVQLFVNGAQEFNLNGNFANGSLGFFTYSQRTATFGAPSQSLIGPPVQNVPEPAVLSLLAASLLAIAVSRRRKPALIT
jgi:Thrombospondin C-terminal region